MIVADARDVRVWTLGATEVVGIDDLTERSLDDGGTAEKDASDSLRP